MGSTVRHRLVSALAILLAVVVATLARVALAPFVGPAVPFATYVLARHCAHVVSRVLARSSLCAAGRARRLPFRLDGRCGGHPEHGSFRPRNTPRVCADQPDRDVSHRLSPPHFATRTSGGTVSDHRCDRERAPRRSIAAGQRPATPHQPRSGTLCVLRKPRPPRTLADDRSLCAVDGTPPAPQRRHGSVAPNHHRRPNAWTL